jgi:hypothetical protein
MAYHLWDGFDDYDLAHELWPVIGGTPQYSSAYARFPAAANCVAQGLHITSGSSQKKTWNMASSQARMLFTFSVLFENFGTSSYNGFLQFANTGNITGALGVSAAGALGLLNATSQTVVLVGSASGVVAPGNYYSFDVDITIGAGSGAIKVYLNTPFGGLPLFSATGLSNLGFSGIAAMNQFTIGDVNGGLGLRFDDFHAMDPTGVAPNNILGAGTRIYTKMPIAPGALSNWTPTGAPANWDCVNDAPPDDDTTYVLAGSSVEDNYGVGSAGIGGSNSVNGIVRRSRMRMDDAGPHTFQNGVRSNGVDQLGAIASVASTYSYADSCSIIDPNTGRAWTPAAADLATPIIYRTT